MGVFLWGCGAKRPEWVKTGRSNKHSPIMYFIGIGKSTDLSKAQDMARAEIAKIIKTEVLQVSRDISQEIRSKSGYDILGEFERVTVSKTNEVLEGVKIEETWKDESDNSYWVLAVLRRDEVEASLKDKIFEIDEKVSKWLEALQTASGVIEKMQIYKQIISLYRDRELYNAQLRVISPDGMAIGSDVDYISLYNEFYKLKTNLKISIIQEGDFQDETREKIKEVLTQAGLSLYEGEDSDLVIKSKITLTPFERGDKYKHILWELSLNVYEGEKVVLSEERRGEEGFLTEDGAKQKSLHSIQSVISDSLLGLLKKITE